MSFQHPASGSSKERKHSSAEIRDKRLESGGLDLGDPEIGPPRAPVHRAHLQGQGSKATEKSYSNRCTNFVAVDEAQQSRKLTASVETKSILRRVKESSGAYPPLKSVAENLCLILDNCEVWHPPCVFKSRYSWLRQQTEVNEQAIESLAPQIKTFSESLCEPILPGDVNEQERAGELER